MADEYNPSDFWPDPGWRCISCGRVGKATYVKLGNDEGYAPGAVEITCKCGHDEIRRTNDNPR